MRSLTQFLNPINKCISVIITVLQPYLFTAVFIVSGMLPLGDVINSIDFNVILMIAGTMGLVALFTESKMPQLLADLVMEYEIKNKDFFKIGIPFTLAAIIPAYVYIRLVYGV